MPSWTDFVELIKVTGWFVGTMIVSFFLFHAWIYHLYNARLKDRQKEINRLAQENREYRERFFKLIDGMEKP